MGVWRVRLHQQGCYTLRLPCVPGQALGPLCHRGWRNGSHNGKDNESGLSRSGRVAALPTAVPVLAGRAATSANGAVTGEGSNAVYGPPAVAGSAAIHHGRAPQLGGYHASVFACLENMMVNIIGTSAKDSGHNCPFHDCCGMQLQVGSKVRFHRERLIYRKGQEEDVLAVYVMGDCTMTCKVGYLPQHLAVRADVYDGLYARILRIYSNRCTNVLKREKFWRNKGCCIAPMLGDRLVLSI
jgi:hypothetical protein